MQGQDNTSNDLSGNFYLDYGSNDINLRSHQNNVVPADAFVHGGHPVMGSIGQSSSAVNNQTLAPFQDLLVEDGLLSNVMDQFCSRLNTQTPIRFQDLLDEDRSLSSPVIGARTDENLVERHCEPIIAPQNGVNMSLEDAELKNRPLLLQQSTSSSLPQNIDLNVGGECRSIDADMNSKTCSRSDTNQNPFVSDSSSSGQLVISSGIAGYVVEENESGEGQRSDGRRLSCKRRAPEDASGEFFLGGSSTSVQQAVTNQITASRRLNLLTPMNNHPNGTYSERLRPGIVIGLEAPSIMHQPSSATESGLITSAGIISNMHQTQRVIGEAADSQRNIRLRRTLNQEDFIPANLAARATRPETNAYAQLPSQPAVLSPFNCVPNTTSVTGEPTPIHLSVSAPNFSETLQPFQWNAVIRSRAMMPSSAYTVNRGEALLLEENSGNNPRNFMLPLEYQRGTMEHLLTNLNFTPVTNSSANIASSSRNSISRVNHSLPPPYLFPQSNMVEQYEEIISDIVNHEESQRRGSYYPRHLGVSVDPRENDTIMRSGNTRPSQITLRSGLIGFAGRQTGYQPELALRSLATAQRRNRLVSEVRNALAFVRRGGSFQFEDVMVIDRSILYGVPEEPDLHEDMRLDVDGMSYEELLALEERIGNVCIGLSEDAILTHMKRRKYQSIALGPFSEDEPCCICQEDYADGEDLGKLDCGHDFHFNCIKQWLIQKNNCPICKMTGLVV